MSDDEPIAWGRYESAARPVGPYRYRSAGEWQAAHAAVPHRVDDALLDAFDDLAHIVQPSVLTTTDGQPLAQSDVRALLALDRARVLTATQLTERLGLEKSSVSRLVAKLERRGLVARRANAHDGRSVVVSLTDSGIQCATAIAAARRTRMRALRRSLSPRQLAALHEAFGNMHAAYAP